MIAVQIAITFALVLPISDKNPAYVHTCTYSWAGLSGLPILRIFFVYCVIVDGNANARWLILSLPFGRGCRLIWGESYMHLGSPGQICDADFSQCSTSERIFIFY